VDLWIYGDYIVNEEKDIETLLNYWEKGTREQRLKFLESIEKHADPDKIAIMKARVRIEDFDPSVYNAHLINWVYNYLIKRIKKLEEKLDEASCDS